MSIEWSIIRTPSVRKLSAVFSDAKLAKKLLTMPYAELRLLPAAQSRIKECMHPPKKYDVRMHALNAIDAGLHGLESIECETSDGTEYADYLNAGDSYAPTLIFWRGAYRVQSVGDFVETLERARISVK